MEQNEFKSLMQSYTLAHLQSIASGLLQNLNDSGNLKLLFETLLSVSDNTLIMNSHTLEMQVEGKLIYDHLMVYRQHLLTQYASNHRFILALPGLINEINKIKLYAPTAKESGSDIENRTIIMGNKQGKSGGFTTTGVQGMAYIRDKQFNQNIPIKSIINQIQGHGLTLTDAIRLFVVVAGLPKSGFQNQIGQWCDVGDTGLFAFSNSDEKQLEYLYFNSQYGGLYSDRAIYSMPFLTISDHLFS